MLVPFLNLIVLPLRLAIWTAEHPAAFFTVLGVVISGLIMALVYDQRRGHFRRNRF